MTHTPVAHKPNLPVGKTLLPVGKILKGDCISEMQNLPDGAIDLVFADPPYNLQLKNTLHRPDQSEVKGVADDWDKFSSFAAYDSFSRAWLSEVRRVLAPDGALWVIGSYHNIFRLGAILQDLGFWILNDVIWRKANPMPNFRGRRLTNAHETLIWAARSQKSRYVFNYGSLKALNDDLQMRSDWHLPICGGKERLRDATGEKVHPTQKPEALLYRVLLASSRPEQIVLDPFLGSGTTAVVAKRLGRHWIGIERDATYRAAAAKRIAATRAIGADEIALATPQEKREEKRIPFGLLLEHGLLRVGDVLTDPTGRYQARVRADGTLIARGQSGDVKGSIHQVGAAVSGATACNGWSFWCLPPKTTTSEAQTRTKATHAKATHAKAKSASMKKSTRQPVVLDNLRRQLRARLESQEPPATRVQAKQ